MIPYIQNLASTKVLTDDFSGLQPADRKGSKMLHNNWSKAPSTKDVFFSMFLGEDRGERVTGKNPPAIMLGVCCDYDTPLSKEERSKKLDKLPTKPTYLSESYSGGTRAVWVFEHPLPLHPSTEATQFLLKNIHKSLKLEHAFGVLDGVFFHPTQYYHRGWNWRDGGGGKIPSELVILWHVEAMKKAAKHLGELAIPMSHIEKEIHRLFPGRWQGPVEVGARNIRFWDPDASNPTGAVICKDGVMAYTGEQRFLTWGEILGADFVERYRSETEGKALSEVFCIKNEFYVRNTVTLEDGSQSVEWVPNNRQNMESLLQSRYGISHIPAAAGELSPLKRTIGDIINLNTLSGTIPLIYDKRDRVIFHGRSYLNISTVEALQPATGTGKAWGDGFPWIAGFLEHLFGGKGEQLDVFISWLARAYQGALAHNPNRGQAVYIAGGAGSGKTFLTECIIAPLFGGKTDASDYLTGRTKFNKALCSSGIWCIDDATPLTEPKAHSYYSAMIKKMVANGSFLYQPKYQDTEDLPWLGRLIILCNTDPESLRILPAVDINNADKLLFFRTTDDPLEEENVASKAQQDLKAFAAYLAQYITPAHCRGGARFGVKQYHHKELYREAVNSGASGVFKEILINFLHNYFTSPHDDDLVDLKGSAQRILQVMQDDPGTEKIIRDMANARTIGTLLGKLLNGEDHFPITYTRQSSGRIWSISREAFFEYMKEVEKTIDD